jgi:hypothetical protein
LPDRISFAERNPIASLLIFATGTKTAIGQAAPAALSPSVVADGENSVSALLGTRRNTGIS